MLTITRASYMTDNNDLYMTLTLGLLILISIILVFVNYDRSSLTSTIQSSTAEKTFIQGLLILIYLEIEFNHLFIPKHRWWFPKMDREILTLLPRECLWEIFNQTLKELYGLRNLQSLFLHYRWSCSICIFLAEQILDIYYPILSLAAIQVKLKDQRIWGQ